RPYLSKPSKYQSRLNTTGSCVPMTSPYFACHSLIRSKLSRLTRQNPPAGPLVFIFSCASSVYSNPSIPAISISLKGDCHERLDEYVTLVVSVFEPFFVVIRITPKAAFDP